MPPGGGGWADNQQERLFAMVSIRTMSLQDYDQVYQLWSQTPGVALYDPDDSREEIAKYLNRNPGTCFVAVREEQVVGVILSGHDGRRAHIYHAAVAEEEQGRGTGGALVAAVMAALEAEGIRKAGLMVFSHNEGGNRFWEKQGFAARGDLTYRDKVIIPSTRLNP